MAQKQDHVKAGLFVLAGIILALIVIFTLADFKSLTQATKPVHVFYQLSDGVQGLKPGAAVTLGDQPIGTVESIEPFYKNHDDGSSQIVGLIVTISIPEEIEIFWDAQIELVVPPLGSGTRLNIASVGGNVGITSSDQREAMEYAPDKQIPWTVVPDWSLPSNQKRDDLKPKQLLALYPGPPHAIPGSIAGSPLIRDIAVNMGIKAKQRTELQQIIENTAAITTTIRNDLPEIATKIKTVMDQANTIVIQARQSLARLDVSLTNIKTITTDLKNSSKQWNARISNTIDHANSAVSKLDDLVVSQQQTFKDSLANVKQATLDAKGLMANLKNNTLDQLNAAMTHVRETMANLKTASTQIRDFAVGQKPIIERTLANAQISAQQLKLATVEIRRSPWRLLHSASEDELETDNLYDAARSFALAAGALQAASASLDAVTRQENTDPKQVKEMVEHLSRIFDKFKATEKIFWDTLGKYSKVQPAK